MTFGMGLTAAGTVRDSHPIPYYSILGTLPTVETDNDCKGTTLFLNYQMKQQENELRLSLF